ncbi:phosphoenolpyruvate mutase [Tumebacillus algifaecis]|uniref:phosphoenolpyruvate mutase n=1 Tax=Tumebacillus algifaecis TaxID=1214604 RepID=A0A223D643_9BACL|nr:phosphoenolpyruvate mutase [Tumebacillus algifaecis]
MRKSTKLRQLLQEDRCLKIIGANDGMTAILGEREGFDGLWASGLAISTSYGVPDASILTMTEFLDAASMMNKASSLPIIADCDTGFGEVNNIIRMIREYENAGIAAVCIEDKNFPKRNSFLEGHDLADMYEFAAKIHIAKAAQTDPDFVVIARLESLIAGMGLEDALTRAQMYADAGADAILVHSKSKEATEVLAFAARWKKIGRKTPLIIVPTTYYTLTFQQAEMAGFSMVIYANQLLRSAVKAMEEALLVINEHGNTEPLEAQMSTVKEVFSLVKTQEATAKETSFDQLVSRLREQEMTQDLLSVGESS